MRKSFLLVLVWAGCGGGGGGASLPFAISGTTPQPGDVDVPADLTVSVTFSRAADLGTVNDATFRLETAHGAQVDGDLLVQGHSPNGFQFDPRFDLAPNTLYRVKMSGEIKASTGEPLGQAVEFTFITRNPVPTVRPDQIIDLGNALNEPRYLARSVRLVDGRVVVFGGHRSDAETSDTAEIYEPATRTFRFTAFPMMSPRAEHTATVLPNGSVILVGGVGSPGGPPLATTEIFDPATESFAPGPALAIARRWHAASHFNAAGVLVSGGLDESDEPLASIEVLAGGMWQPFAEDLPEPTAQHVQVTRGVDQVYFGVGNFQARAGRYDPSTQMMHGFTEGDIRFRSAWVAVAGDRVLVVGGDTRSMVTFDFDGPFWNATGLLRERRGAHTVTPRDPDGNLFLAAGGFNIAVQGAPALQTMEVVEYLPQGPFGFPDADSYRVENLLLPAVFAGHVGFLDPDGNTVLAGGWGAATHSRRVALVLAD